MKRKELVEQIIENTVVEETAGTFYAELAKKSDKKLMKILIKKYAYNYRLN
jgi:hypothetical protein